ncbi:hypothetical protein [Alloactinosynnema sp. L-07]|nr:hypothetical protein [Alloactinosynnema sp. L-07]
MVAGKATRLSLDAFIAALPHRRRRDRVRPDLRIMFTLN